MRMRVPMTQFLRVCVTHNLGAKRVCVCDSIFACVDDPNTRQQYDFKLKCSCDKPCEYMV